MAKISTRVAFGEALAQLGGQNDKILVFDADVSTCTMTCYFGEKYPERFFNCGIQEANMVGMAAGASTVLYVTSPEVRGVVRASLNTRFLPPTTPPSSSSAKITMPRPISSFAA